ncbi:FLII [Cordylochernes scorpioides]|uniref:FLII n=1 Tax=Cordylochernes scorpioides TaxID=51811 RepID=A0ABY6KZG1_9ARAC|nr:FLII [Cordylochernes scorpioides]
MDRKKVCKKSSAKKKMMSIELKREIIEKHEQGVRVLDLSRQYGRSTSMICSVLKRKESIKSATPAKGFTIISKLRTSLKENMEKLLMVWVTEKQLQGDTLTQTIICEKARAIYGDLLKQTPQTSIDEASEESFKASRGWFENFKRGAVFTPLSDMMPVQGCNRHQMLYCQSRVATGIGSYTASPGLQQASDAILPVQGCNRHRILYCQSRVATGIRCYTASPGLQQASDPILPVQGCNRHQMLYCQSRVATGIGSYTASPGLQQASHPIPPDIDPGLQQSYITGHQWNMFPVLHCQILSGKISWPLEAGKSTAQLDEKDLLRTIIPNACRNGNLLLHMIGTEQEEQFCPPKRTTEEYFPRAVGEMTGLRWLRLNKAKIDWIPDELSSLQKLESLSLVRNNLVTLHGEVPTLSCLRSINCRGNKLKNCGVPPELFNLDDLSVVEEYFPRAVGEMTGLRWLRLNKAKIDWIPDELSSLQKLESLSLVRNNLVTLHGEVPTLSCLRSINCRGNKLKNCGVPPELFNLDDLSVVNVAPMCTCVQDFSKNQLRKVPYGLEHARGILVLNISQNFIESIPSHLFVNLTDLICLDLANNCLESLPPQMRRLGNLQTLDLSHNPLGHNQLREVDPGVALNLRKHQTTRFRTGHLKPLKIENNNKIYPTCPNYCDDRQLPALVSLRTLKLRNTQRTLANTPASLECLVNLTELDLSQNNLPRVPDAIFTLSNLQKLNLSDNSLTELSAECGSEYPPSCLPTEYTTCGVADNWRNMEILNLARNNIKVLPNVAPMCTCVQDFSKNQLRKVPYGLEHARGILVLNISQNFIESIPSHLFVNLTDLIFLDLANNCLESLPPQMRRLGNLQTLDLSHNPLGHNQLRLYVFVKITTQKNRYTRINLHERWHVLAVVNVRTESLP